MCNPNFGIFAKKALNPGFIPIKDDPHLKTQQQIDYNDTHPKILPPVFTSAYESPVASAFAQQLAQPQPQAQQISPFTINNAMAPVSAAKMRVVS